MLKSEKPKEDRRVKRTKLLVFEAFYQLVQSSRYDELKAKDIVKRAGIGKSTFYEHFLDKDDVLRQSLERPMTVFAKALVGNADDVNVARTLDHFWERRKFARVILQHPTREIVDNCLRAQIKAILDKSRHANERETHAHSCFLSSGFISLLNEWLTGRVSLSTERMMAYITNNSLQSFDC